MTPAHRFAAEVQQRGLELHRGPRAAGALLQGGDGRGRRHRVEHRGQARGEQPLFRAAQAYAAGVVAARCVRDAGTTADDAVRAAALECTTLFARFRLDAVTGAQVGHRTLTVQWQDARRRVVWPPESAEAPVRTLHR